MVDKIKHNAKVFFNLKYCSKQAMKIIGKETPITDIGKTKLTIVATMIRLNLVTV
jgi:hypothetical protein